MSSFATLRSFASVLSLGLVAMSVSTARASLDPLCGTTLTSNLTLTADVDCTGFTGNALTVGAPNITIDGAGFRLIAPDAARAISLANTAFNNLTVRNLDLSGHCTGTGIFIDGASGHTLENLRIDGRVFGLDIRNTQQVVLRNIDADGASTAALRLLNVSLPLTLQDLSLTNSAVGLRVSGLTGPWTLDTTAITSLDRNDTAIWFEANVANITVRNLAARGHAAGINAAAATITNLTLQNLDVSAPTSGGTGLALGGSGHSVTNLTANLRSTGIAASGTSNLSLRGIRTGGGATAGISITNHSGTLALTDLTVIDSLRGLWINGFDGGGSFVLGPYNAVAGTGAITSLEGCDIGIQLANARNLAVDGLTLRNEATAIDASATNNSNIRFSNLVLDAIYPGGTGLVLGGADHRVNDVTAHDRANGVRATSTSNLQVTRLSAQRNTTTGLLVESAALPLVLTNLDLRNNETALHLNNVSGTPGTPYEVGAWNGSTGAIASVAGSNRSIQLTNTRDIALRGLTLDGRSNGVLANNSANARISLFDCNLSGSGVGTGADLRGPGHDLRRVTVHDRATGVLANFAAGIRLEDMDVRRASGSAILIQNITAAEAAPTLLRVNARDSGTGLNFNTVRAPFTLSTAQVLDLGGSLTGLRFDNCDDLTVRDLALGNRDYGAFAEFGNRRLSFIDVDFSGPAAGIGLRIGNSAGATTTNHGGPGHRVIGCTSNDRATGFDFVATQGLVAEGLTATRNATTGLIIRGLVASDAAPTVADLDLRDNALALVINGVASPMVIDGTLGLDVAGSTNGIYIINSVGHIFRDLAVPTSGYGIYADFGNSTLTFERVDVSGFGTNTGLRLGNTSGGAANLRAGPDHTLVDVVANDRATGVLVLDGDRLVVSGLTATACGTGLDLRGLTTDLGAPALADLVLSNNDIALSFNGFRKAMTLDAATTSIDFTGSGTGIFITRSSLLGVRGYTVPATDTGIRVDLDSSGLLFENLDLSGRGDGIGLFLGNTLNPNPVFHAGPDHVVRQVRADDRRTGIYAIQPTNLSLADITVRRAIDHGVYLNNPVLPLTLQRLQLEHSGTGLRLRNLTATAAVPFVIAPANGANPNGAITSLAGNGTSLLLQQSAFVTANGLRLDGATTGMSADANCSSITATNIDASGVGGGIGIALRGANPRITNSLANDRATAVYFEGTTNPFVDGLSVSGARTAALHLATTTLPISLANLRLENSTLGLRFQTVTGTGSFAVNAGVLTSIAGTLTAVNATSAPAISVDAAGLGLVQAGSDWSAPLPPVVAPCGTTITTSLTLTADLDCTGVTGNAITVGADDLIIEGNGHRIIAPHATNVITATNRRRVTVRNLDVSGPRGVGRGVVIQGAVGHVVSNVTADGREIGVEIRDTIDFNVAGVRARQNLTTGLWLRNVTVPFVLSNNVLERSGGQGLRLTNVDGQGALPPSQALVIGPSGIAGISGNATSILLETTTRDVTVTNLALDGSAAGVSASTTDDVRLNFRNLDLSPVRPGGTGLVLRGHDHRVEGIVAQRRATGLDVRNADRPTLADVSIQGAHGTGIYFDLITMPTLRDLAVDDSLVGVHLYRSNGTAAQPIVLDRWNAVAGTGAFASLARNPTTVYLQQVEHVHVRDLALAGLTFGLRAEVDANANIALSNVDASAPRTSGTAIRLHGNSHQIAGLQAARRVTGLDLRNGSAANVSDVQIERTTGVALQLLELAPPLTLSNLAATRSGVGLWLRGHAAASGSPLVLDPHVAGGGAIASLARNTTSLRLASSRNVRVERLALDGTDLGLDANDANNTNITFDRLDTSAAYPVGTGLYVAGSQLVVQDAVSNRRATGVRARDATLLSLAGLSIDRTNGTALLLGGLAAVPTVRNVSITNAVVGVGIDGLAAPAGAPFVLGPWNGTTGAIARLDETMTSISLANARFITIDGLRLSGRTFGLNAAATTNADISARNVDASGFGVGTGLHLRGTNAAADNVVAFARSTALVLDRPSGGRVRNANLARNRNGLFITNLQAGDQAPAVDDVTATLNDFGLTVQSHAVPMTIDGNRGNDFRGNDTSVLLQTNTSAVTLRDLTLDGPTAGLDVRAPSDGHRVERVDASGRNAGNGLLLRGTNHTLSDVVANRRAQGVYLVGANGGGFVVDGVVAHHNTNGIFADNFVPASTPPVFTALDLRNNTQALHLNRMESGASVDGAAGVDLRNCNTSIYVNTASANIELRDLTLDGWAYGLRVGATNQRVTAENLDTSGRGRGRGVEIAGADHIVTGLVSNQRVFGLYSPSSSNLFMGNLSLAQASSAALRLDAIRAPSAPPLLSAIRAERSVQGLVLVNVAGPLVLNPAALASLDGNETSIAFANDVNGVTVRDLRLDGPAAGLAANDYRNSNNLLERLDASGACRGTGLALAGSGNRVVTPRIVERAVGLSVGNASANEVTGGLIAANGTGISVTGVSSAVTASVVADAANTATRFRVNSVGYAFVGQTIRVTIGATPHERVLTAISGAFLTVDTALPAVPPEGSTVVSLDVGAPRLTLTQADICANGAGASVGDRPVSAGQNFWRATSGPRITSNPGGTGDVVVGAGLDFSGFRGTPSDKLTPFCNQPPVVVMPAAQGACQGNTVTLDGSASTDPDAESLTLAWRQTGGPTASLSSATIAAPTFVAPAPVDGSGNPVDNAVLAFALRAADDQVAREGSTTVLVTRRNAAPVVTVAETALTVDEGASVSFDASTSFDPDAQPIVFFWQQLAGTPVILANGNTPTPSFTAPTLDVGGGPTTRTLDFRVTVTDRTLPVHCGGDASTSVDVRVTVRNVNRTPVARAGDDRSAFELTTVQLDGSASSDPDNDTLTWLWEQTGGPTVVITNANQAVASFAAPDQAPLGETTYTFRLTVNDGFGGVATDSVAITVVDVCPDSDGDGVIDCLEECPQDPAKLSPGACGCGVPDTDGDGDGTPNCNDGCPTDATKVAPGACGCGVPDTDGDNDGTPNCNDGCPADATKIAPGQCGCGVADTDGDGDGTANCNDGCPADAGKTAPGQCGCGVADTDNDGDGTANCNDGCPLDAAKIAAGLCGCGVADTDTDDDNTPDCTDGCATDPLKTAPGACGCGTPDIDGDGDGIANCNDECPTDPAKAAPGLCGCGVADTDADDDNVPDCLDGCPLDALKTLPGLCGCGVADTDGDLDGTPDCTDVCPEDAAKVLAGLCGCGVADTDGDNDNTPDCLDGCPTDPAKATAGLCGCNVADTDSDDDGSPDCLDACANDPNKTVPGLCGCGTADTDTDNDLTPDCNDLCPLDATKVAAGLCGCGVADTDSDEDGTPDCDDACPEDPAKTSPGACGCGVNPGCVECDSPAACDDGNICTDDVCTEAGVCANPSRTAGSACADGVCDGAPSGPRCVGCIADGNCGEGRYCNLETTTCVACLVDAHCADQSFCTTDVCAGGTCVNDPLDAGADCPGGTCSGAGACVLDTETFITVLAPTDGETLGTSTVTVRGEGEPGATVRVIIRADIASVNQDTEVRVADDGTWSVVFAEVPDGLHFIEASARDRFDNTAQAPTFPVAIDTQTEVAIIEPVAGSVTVDGIGIWRGLAEAGATVTLLLDGVEIAQVTADEDRAWQYPVTEPLAEGTRSLVAVAVDAVGNRAETEPVVFTVDAAAATIAISEPLSGSAIDNGLPRIAGLTQADAAVRVAVFTADGRQVAVFTPEPDDDGNFEVQMTGESLADGGYRVEAEAVRPNGRRATAESIFTVDTRAPELVVEAPTEGVNLPDGSLRVEGSTEPGLNVQVIIAGEIVAEAQADDDGRFAIAVDVSFVEGENLVEIRTVDAAGNASEVARIVVLDSVPPVIAIASPADGTLFAERTVEVSGTSEPALPVTVTRFDARGLAAEALNTVSDDAGLWSVLFEGVADGRWTIGARARDLAGNVGDAEPVAFEVLSAAPRLEITTPTQGLVTNVPTLVVVGVTDGDATVSLLVSSTGGIDIVRVEGLEPEADGRFEWPAGPDVGEGAFVLTAVATGRSGLETRVTVDFVVDRTAPALAIDFPAEDEELEVGFVTVEGTTEVGATVSVTFDDEAPIAANVTAAGAFTARSAGELEVGEHRVRAVASDAAGNLSTVEVAFVVAAVEDPAEPGVEPVEPGPVESPESEVERPPIDTSGCGCQGGEPDASWLFVGVLWLFVVLRRRTA
jgi:hypothetical protein